MTNHQRLRIDQFDYHLPNELIAQEPLADRSGSRLLTLDRQTGDYADRSFVDLPDLLRADDLLVVNDSRVIPARLLGHRSTGGKVEILLLRPDFNGGWHALAKPVRRLKIGETLTIPASDASGVDGAVVLREKLEEGQVRVELDEHLARELDRFGHVPLPPYITHQLDDDARYQTVYAQERGSAAAPTAGLHFTDTMFDQLRSKGVEIAAVTLHVGLDTFRPVTVDYVDEHEIHSEWCTVPQATWDAIRRARSRGGRVIAVGTTSARTLESLGQHMREGHEGPFDGFTRIYITPGYEWTMVDAMITNFHLPKSTLLLMISSFASKDSVFRAYAHAIQERYRFFSFGDAMFLY